jgi:hypothetical protein
LRLLVLWLAVALCSLNPDLALAQKSPDALANEIIRTSTERDERGAQKLWDSKEWSKSADNDGYSLYQQSARFSLVTLQLQAQQERAVLTMHVLVSGKVKDLIYIHATKAGKVWRAHSVHESPELARVFLAGKVPARFDFDALPTHASLAALGDKLVQAWGSDEPPEEALRPLHTRIHGKNKLRLKRTVYLESIQRGLLEFAYFEDLGIEGMEPYETTAVGYFEQQEGRWVLYDTSMSPSPTRLVKGL